MTLRNLKVHAMRDEKRALCGRVIGSEKYTGGHGQRIAEQASVAAIRVLGVDCESCLRIASIDEQPITREAQ